MKNIYLKFLIFTIIILSFSSISFAETSTTSSSTEDVEISLPLQKEDFLLFYGLTNDKIKNTEIIELRNSFMLKFKDLKDNYTESFHKLVDGYDLISSIPEDVEKVDSTIKSENDVVSTDANLNSKITNENKASSSKEVNSTKQAPVDTVKRYIIQNTKDTIDPIVNIIGSKINIKTESSS